MYSLQVSFDQYRAQLEEWLTRRQIYAHTSEILACYARGIAVEETGLLIVELIAEDNDQPR